MPGRAKAVSNGASLIAEVKKIAEKLDLELHEQVEVGRRLWGARRKIDIVMIEKINRKSIGIECKFQGTPGTAEEKIPATVNDIIAWPIPGLVVFAGEGFTPNMISYLLASGKAVELADLEQWLRLFYGFALPKKHEERSLFDS